MNRSVTNRPDIDLEVQSDFALKDGQTHEDFETVFQHGRWYINCNRCTAQWAVFEVLGIFTYNRIQSGDGSCERESQRREAEARLFEDEPAPPSDPLEPELDCGNPADGAGPEDF